MRGAVLLAGVGVMLIASIVLWLLANSSPSTGENGGSQVETNLQLAFQRLREAPLEERQADASLVANVLTLAEALADVGDARQKQVAAGVTKNVGRMLFGEESFAGGEVGLSSIGSHQVIPYPGPLPALQVTPMVHRYIGTYSGLLVGRTVEYVVTVTERGLLGVRVVGLNEQPTMEFAELKPNEFFRPDSRVAIVFADETKYGFRTMHVHHQGLYTKAENTALLSAANK